MVGEEFACAFGVIAANDVANGGGAAANAMVAGCHRETRACVRAEVRASNTLARDGNGGAEFNIWGFQ